MSDWRADTESARTAFVTVAKLAGNPISPGEISIEYLPAPHRPPSRLPTGKMAVYGFWGDGVWLKIGKAGPNSNARYTSQHYDAGSARSTLAGSLRATRTCSRSPVSIPTAPGDWIKAATHRVNILLPSQRPDELLLLLEAFLHLRLRPRYEG